MAVPWQARHGLTPEAYQKSFDALAKQGYRLTEVSGYADGNQPRYAAIWEKLSGPAWAARHGLSATQYQAEFDKLAKQGFRLKEISGYAVGGKPQYAAIWEKAAGPAWVARHGLTAAQYQAEFDKLVKQGYRLKEVSGTGVGNQAVYAAIWEKKPGPPWVARHGLTSAQYQAEFQKLAKQGYRLKSVSGYAVGGSSRYAAIWEKVAGRAWAARHGMSSAEYQGEFNNFLYQGYRLTWVDGHLVAGKPRFAAVWQSEGMRDADLAQIDEKLGAYVSKHGIPGLSIAISRNERLVFARGFGFADRDAKQKVHPLSRFRIASISKPVTAVAVMELVETGKLKLDQKVFGSGALLGTTYGSKPYGARVKAITVRHLLQHTSGWSNEDKDPMFMSSSLGQKALIDWMLDNRTPKAAPGTAYEYLNFGYCLLGRIIEKVTGPTYEAYVKSVLKQCGVTAMEIGGAKLSERKPGEVVYYGGSPYNLLPRRMDAHGGWIASTVDLLRFMARTDGFAAKTDILEPGTQVSMNTGSTPNAGYGAGWIVDSSWRGHNGAMAGTIGFLVRRNDGFSYAVLANTRPDGDKFCFELKGVMDEVVGAVGAWPGYDLF
jgi:CubicO group peptidase (beta-lactamase class C family)